MQTLRIGVVMDPIEKINIDKDTTFVLMLETQRREHELYFMELDDLFIRGGTPRVVGLARTRQGIERGDPVAILGYPLGFDLPMEAQGGRPIAEPTLTVGTVSKALTSVVQVDAYGAPGSSGSPIFDREGKVIAVLYGGERESQGKIIFAVPAYIVADYLKSLSLLR